MIQLTQIFPAIATADGSAETPTHALYLNVYHITAVGSECVSNFGSGQKMCTRVTTSNGHGYKVTESPERVLAAIRNQITADRNRV